MAIMIDQESSSLSKFKHNYQVFLSFRGEDTRKTFTDHLYTALVQQGIHTFRDDDEIERGKKLDLELSKAIQESRIAVIVFSKNYANSTWCLNEVLMILEWSKLRGNDVLPIYYDVDPSEVRKQKGSIGEAFAKFEETFIHNHDTNVEKKVKWTKKLKEWRAALQQISILTGMVLKNQADGHEAKFIQNILNEVERKLNRQTLYIDRHLVRMDYRVISINTWLRDSSSSVNIFVICGMGGIGKTTIAKYVYNHNFQKFEGSCFLASIKEACERPGGLVKLQMQLLSSILKGTKNEIYNVDEGIILINDAICTKRVLLVIDDVDKVDQLDALLGIREFYPGSKVFITTRNKTLLNRSEIYKIHEVQPLYNNESLELFSWYAFGKDHPENGYLEKSIKAVDYCGGLPLALKILGSSLSGKKTEVWESTLAKMESIPRSDILNILNTSFDSLQDDHDRNLFLHITCFFVGHDKDETIEILDACEFYTVCGIQNLVDKCLISINQRNEFTMHQLIQEMGRQIVYRESPNEPWNRSRLWHYKDSFRVLKEKKGIYKTEGLTFDMQLYKNYARESRKGRKRSYDEYRDVIWPFEQSITFRSGTYNFFFPESSSDVVFDCDSFSRMDNLKLLTLNYARVSGSYENFPKGLVWLCWHGFSLKSICLDHLPLKNIVSLDMSYSKLQHFWIGNKVIESLKILNLSHSQRLVKISNFGRLLNLKNLILEGCVSLVDMCDTIGNLERLSFLNIKNCKSLKKFPNIGIRNKCLQSIILDGCVNIASELLKVVADNGAITTSPPSTCDPVRKWYTMFKPTLRPLQQNGYLLRYVVSLSLQNCNLSVDDFPPNLSPLSTLQTLDLSGNPLINLPPCITNLNKLYRLSLNSCDQLHEVLDLPSTNCLSVNDCGSLERITFQPRSLKPHILMNKCTNLVNIQDTFKMEPLDKVNLETLRILGLDNMQSIRSHMLRLKSSTNLPAIANMEAICWVLHEFGIFSTFLRQEETSSSQATEIYTTSSSSSISFIVDSKSNSKVRGLNVRYVYTLCNTIYEKTLYPTLLTIKIVNVTKNFNWVYVPAIYGIPEGAEDELVWLSYWKFGSLLESGDEVQVSVFCTNDFIIKEVGIKLVLLDEEEEEHNDHQSCPRGMICGDLSDYQYTNKGHFVLFHLGVIPTLSCLLYQKVFGDNVMVEDLWNWFLGGLARGTAVSIN